MTEVKQTEPGTWILVDWAGREIREGDTVVWSPGERYGIGMPYGTVGYIKVTSEPRRTWRYNTPDGRWALDATAQYVTEDVKVVKVMLRPEKTGYGYTISSENNPYVYGSITRFTKEG